MIKKLIFTGMLILSSTAWAADDILNPSKVISAVTYYDNHELLRVVLVEGEKDYADLLIYFIYETPDNIVKTKLITESKKFLEYASHEPIKMKIMKDGLEIYSSFSSFGNLASDEKIKLAYRNDSMIVAGYTYHDHNRTSLEENNCDINFLTDKGIYNHKIFSAAKAPLLQNWHSYQPSECNE